MSKCGNTLFYGAYVDNYDSRSQSKTKRKHNEMVRTQGELGSHQVHYNWSFTQLCAFYGRNLLDFKRNGTRGVQVRYFVFQKLCGCSTFRRVHLQSVSDKYFPRVSITDRKLGCNGASCVFCNFPFAPRFCIEE